MFVDRSTYGASAISAHVVVATVIAMLVMGPVVFNAAAMCKRAVPHTAAPASGGSHAKATGTVSDVIVGVSTRSQSDPAPLQQQCASLAALLATQKAPANALRSLSDELSDASDLLASFSRALHFPLHPSDGAGMTPARPSLTSSDQHPLKGLSSVVLLL